MITNFEQHTCDLTTSELALTEDIKDAFISCLTAHPQKSDVVEYKINCHLYERRELYKMTATKLRKWCNRFRSTGSLPILASSEGYFLTYDKDEIGKQVKSLRERANSINAAAEGLERFLPNDYFLP